MDFSHKCKGGPSCLRLDEGNAMNIEQGRSKEKVSLVEAMQSK